MRIPSVMLNKAEDVGIQNIKQIMLECLVIPLGECEK